MINIPIWLFVIMCICSAIFIFIIILSLIDIISEQIYQKHELTKYKNKEKNNG